MATEYKTISISMPADSLEMLKEIARIRHGRDERVISLTVDQLIREEYDRLDARKHPGTITPARSRKE